MHRYLRLPTVAFACPGQRFPMICSASTGAPALSRRMSCAIKFIFCTIQNCFWFAQLDLRPARIHGGLLYHSAIYQDLPSTSSTPASKMNLLICLVLAAVATTTTYGEAPEVTEGRLNELADGVKVLSDILTHKETFGPLLRFAPHPFTPIRASSATSISA